MSRAIVEAVAVMSVVLFLAWAGGRSVWTDEHKQARRDRPRVFLYGVTAIGRYGHLTEEDRCRKYTNL